MTTFESQVHDTGVRNTSCFSPESLVKLTEIMYDKKWPANTSLYEDGDLADKLYYLKSGSVKITKSSPDGKQIIMCIHQEGDLFGQVDPFQQSTHSFRADTLEDTVIGVIQQRDLEILLWRHGELAVEFMKWMGLMHRVTQTKFRDLMMFGKPGALCSTLIRLTNTYGEQKKDGIWISKKQTHTDLAEMIGATRESVNRMLSDLKTRGVLSYDQQHLVIHDLDYLRDICHCENCPKDICRM